MSAKILQINFKFSVPADEYDQAVAPLAKEIASVPGLQWKVWLINAAEHEAGGIYLFDDAASLQAYLNGPIIAGMSHHPALSDFSFKQFDVMDEATSLTKGPVNAPAQVQ